MPAKLLKEDPHGLNRDKGQKQDGTQDLVLTLLQVMKTQLRHHFSSLADIMVSASKIKKKKKKTFFFFKRKDQTLR